MSCVDCGCLQSAIRALVPLTKLPGMISLGGGNPNSALFPFSGKVTCISSLLPKILTSLSLTHTHTLSLLSIDLKIGLKSGVQLDVSGDQIEECLQYSPTRGLPGLVKHLNSFQVAEHGPKQPFELMVTAGSQEGLTRAFEMLLSPGDTLLVEEPTYSGALAFLQPFGVNLVGVATDGQGLRPDALASTLAELKAKGVTPKALYVIPTGQNPSGATLSLERRKQIISLANQYDFVVLEDDPYYYLYYGTEAYDPTRVNFTRPRVKSLLSLDTEGRVLRFDSLSKVLSSGIRIGFVTGPPELIERLELHAQATTLHTSGLSQVATQALLDHWGPEGWNTHVDSVVRFYHGRRDVMLRALDNHLDGMADWSSPSAGMFVWLQLRGIKDTKNFIDQKARDAKVILVPGQVFDPLNKPSTYVRAAFSIASDEQIDQGIARLANLLKQQ